MIEPKKLDRWEKIWLYPELDISIPPRANKVYVSMRSPKVLLAPENGEYKVGCIQSSRNGEIYDIMGLYETTKQAIKVAVDEYYKLLYDAELYALPESMTDAKILDAFMTVEERKTK